MLKIILGVGSEVVNTTYSELPSQMGHLMDFGEMESETHRIQQEI